MDQIKQLIDQYGPQVWNNIAAPVWAAAVRQAFADGVGGLVTSLGLLGVFVFLFVCGTKVRRFAERSKADWSEDDYAWGVGIGWFITTAAVVGGLAIVSSSFADAAKHFINPEWYAIQNLLGAVKK